MADTKISLLNSLAGGSVDAALDLLAIVDTSGTETKNITPTALAVGMGAAVVSGTLAQFAATTSLQLKGVISDETGSGALVFADTPTLVTPNLGVASATSINKVALTPPASGSTLTIADGATLTVNGSATITNGTHSGTNTGDQTSISGNAGTVTVADAGADTTTWVLLGTSQTGSLTPASDAGLTYNASTDALTAATFIGALTGTASGNLVSGGALGTPSSGTLTNCSGLPIAGLSASTSTAIGVGSIELGHATDTTITRTGSGDIAVEGNAVYRAGGTDVPVTDGGTGSSTAAGAIANLGGLPTAGGTMSGDITLGENTAVALDPAGSADGKYTGITVTGTGGATIAFGDLITLDKDDSRWELVDISVAAAATGDARGIIGIAVTSSTDGTAVTVLLHGIIRADANFPALTIGAPIYASTTGDVVVAQPTTTDHVIRIVGYGLTADEMLFNPGNSWTTHI